MTSYSWGLVHPLMVPPKGAAEPLPTKDLRAAQPQVGVSRWLGTEQAFSVTAMLAGGKGATQNWCLAGFL